MFHRAPLDECEVRYDLGPPAARRYRAPDKADDSRRDGAAFQAGTPKVPMQNVGSMVSPRPPDSVLNASPPTSARSSRKNKIYSKRAPTAPECDDGLFSQRTGPPLASSPRPAPLSGRSKESMGAEKWMSKPVVSTEDMVTLELGASSAAFPPKDAERTLYVRVLKQMLGEEVRLIIREEFERNASTPRRPPRRTDGEQGDGAPDTPRLEGGDQSATEEEFETPAAAGRLPGQDSMQDIIQDLDADVDVDIDKHASYVEDGIKEIATSHHLVRTTNRRDKFARWSAMNPVLYQLDRVRRSFGTVTAPGENTRLRRVVESRWWNAIVNLVVVVNCVVMSLSADYQIKSADVESSDGVFFWLDIAVLIFYAGEFSLKLAVYGRFFFYDVNWRTNWFDTVLLFTSWGSVVFTLIAESQQLHQNYTWLRLFRLLRLLRTLRVIRLASYFSTLRGILSSLLDSFWTFAWSITMLSLMFFMFSLIFVSRVAGIIQANRDAWEAGEYELLLTYFGSVSRAAKTLTMAATGGTDWGEIYSALEPAGSFLDAALFIFFIFFIQIAVLNIILGIFVEDAMKHMQPDTEQKAHELALEQARLEDELLNLCSKTDLNQSGKISTVEWEIAMQDGKVHELLDLLGFPRRHANKFFKMMAHTSPNGDKYVHVDDFVKGCIKLRGSASSFDMNAVLLEVKDTRELVMSQVKMLQNLILQHRRRMNSGESLPA